MAELETCFGSALWSAHSNIIEGKTLQDSYQTSYDLWNMMLTDQEATHAQNEYNKDKNIQMDVW